MRPCKFLARFHMDSLEKKYATSRVLHDMEGTELQNRASEGGGYI